MDNSTESVNETAAPETSQRMSSPPIFDSPRVLKRASLPARPPTAVARHTKRLTLNFPINLPTAPISRSDLTSPALITPASSQSSIHPSPAPRTSTPALVDELNNDGYDFLTAIAAQERKVLELREELQRAETELATLKKQWALAERTRKRTDVSIHAEALKSLRSPERVSADGASEKSGTDSSSIAQKRFSRDLDRQNIIRSAPGDGGTSISANGRRVFHGSRHTRTLSLLSPEMGGGASKRDGDNSTKPEGQRIGRTPRSATLPSIERSTDVTAARTSAIGSTGRGDGVAQWRRSLPPPASSGEALMRTGKQMASDLREGFWTFLEDIRQATVGEEGISATESRTVQPARRTERSVTPRSRERPVAGSTAVARSNSSASSTRERGSSAAAKSGKDTTPADISMSFWSEFGVDIPGQTSTTSSKPAKGTPNEQKEQEDSSLLDVDDNWDVWDTPQPSDNKTHTPSSSRSTIESKRDQSPATQMSSPRTSTRYV